MRIEEYSSVTSGYISKASREVNSAEFSAKAESKSANDPLQYYYDLCKEFPDISFRLDDVSEMAKHQNSNTPYLGYHNSMNQVGDNFGGIGHCSIALDIEVIRKMQQDPQYAQHVRGMIENTQRYYPEYQARALEEGYQYISVSIEDENGTARRGITQSNMPYSTEEEIREMWNMEDTSKRAKHRFDKQTQELLDSYLKMFDESRIRRQELREAMQKKSQYSEE